MHLGPATPSVECARYSRELVKICGISAVRLVSLIGESTALKGRRSGPIRTVSVRIVTPFQRLLFSFDWIPRASPGTSP
jgi:hypothetical protein